MRTPEIFHEFEHQQRRKMEELLLKYNFPKIQANNSADEIEKQIGFPLPNDYKNFLGNYSGFNGVIGEQYIALWDCDNLLELNNEYGINAALENTIGIGTNGASEFLAIKLLHANNYQVVVSPLIDLDEQYHIEIGSSFTDFLQRLDRKEEWFK